MKTEYFSAEKHEYMKASSEAFSHYIFSLIEDGTFLNYDTAVELGAGMGRFSTPLVKSFSHVVLVEPAVSYSGILKAFFSGANLNVMNIKAENFLAEHTPDKPVIVFCFHLMHHLKYDQRKLIYQFIKRTGSKCVMVEPNPFNPLILFQILLHRDMSFSEENRYLTLTQRRYRDEMKANDLVISSFRRICFFPPFATGFLLKYFSRRTVYSFEAFNKFFPFMSSYQLIICEEPAK